MSYMKKFIICFLFSLLFLLCACSRGESQSSSQTLNAVNTQSNAVPAELAKIFGDAGLRLLREKISSRDFSLSTTAGETLSLSHLKGKVVFLNFWATWCGPCRMEMPSMETLYSRFKNDGLEIVAVNCMETGQEVASFMKNNGFTFPAALDTDGKVNGEYGVQAIPTSYLMDRDGKIIMRLVGSIDWDTPQINAAFQSLLDK